jgi:hypothetical protein
LNDQVAVLRQSLTFTIDKPFDAAPAYQIYQQTLGPIASRFADKRRISVITKWCVNSDTIALGYRPWSDERVGSRP